MDVNEAKVYSSGVIGRSGYGSVQPLPIPTSSLSQNFVELRLGVPRQLARSLDSAQPVLPVLMQRDSTASENTALSHRIYFALPQS